MFNNSARKNLSIRQNFIITLNTLQSHCIKTSCSWQSNKYSFSKYFTSIPSQHTPHRNLHLLIPKAHGKPEQPVVTLIFKSSASIVKNGQLSSVWVVVYDLAVVGNDRLIKCRVFYKRKQEFTLLCWVLPVVFFIFFGCREAGAAGT